MTDAERADCAEAACAEMRAALERTQYSGEHMLCPVYEGYVNEHEAGCLVRHALSTDAGKGWVSPQRCKSCAEWINAVADRLRDEKTEALAERDEARSEANRQRELNLRISSEKHGILRNLQDLQKHHTADHARLLHLESTLDHWIVKRDLEYIKALEAVRDAAIIARRHSTIRLSEHVGQVASYTILEPEMDALSAALDACKDKHE